ncbi:MAG: DUF4255 domain-containing protein [Acidimicrobiia bacterium]|nr:DUF4255 domain-containing protein [Acidimicrobiia bacterium]
MATHRAIEAASDAVIELLRDNYPAEVTDPQLQFKVFTRSDFEIGLTAGVSLFVYRVYVDGSERAPDGRVGEDGRKQRPQLPVQLHFLLTAWAPTASLQHLLIGWMMRTLEDYPVLPAGLLNRRYDESDPVFWPDETVELSTAPMDTEDLFGLFDQLGDEYRLSVPYQARGIRIESARVIEEYEPVQERVRRYRKIEVSS